MAGSISWLVWVFLSEHGVSIAAIIAIPFYLAVALLCLKAARAPVRRRDRTSARGTWLVATWVFATMAFMRVFEVEERTRAALRLQLQIRDLYDTRRDVQSMIAIAIVLVALALIAMAYRSRPDNIRDQRSVAVWSVRWILVGFAVLIALRVVSFTIVDRILFGGPIHINWLLDGGMTVAAATAAIVFAKPLERRHDRKDIR